MSNAGKDFEKDFKDSYEKTSYTCIRLVDSAKWLQGSGSKFQASNIADFIVLTSPYMWVLELKSTKGSSISHTPYVEGVSAPWEKPKNDTTQVMIKANQVKSLMKLTKKPYVIPGFLFNFRERALKTKTIPHQTYFVHINDFINYAQESKASSIGVDTCRDIGIPLDGIVKKVNYKYDVEKLTKDVVERMS